METYKELISKVLRLLEEYGYQRTSLNYARRCFRDLEAEIISRGCSYSPPMAEEWCQGLGAEFGDRLIRHYRNALRFLAEMYETGTIQNKKPGFSYKRLTGALHYHLDTFLKDASTSYSRASVLRFKGDCSRFLLYMQDHGVTSIPEIDYELMRSFYADSECGEKIVAQQIQSATSLLTHFYSSGLIRYGATVYYHYLATGGEPTWKPVSKEDDKRIRAIMASEDTEDPERLVNCRTYLESLYQQNEYSKGQRNFILRHADLLYLFLDYNHYRYHPEIARIWYLSKDKYLCSPSHRSHRSICLIEQYMKDGSVDVDSFFKSNPRGFDLLPEWCWKAAHEYESMKLREGWAISTMDMVRSSIIRFCHSLDQQGVHSFAELTADHIKTFNMNDKHKTPAGKNAYNTRIRKFLIFLSEKQYLSNPMLFTALSRENAPKETIVVVLTKDEMRQLNACIQNDCAEVSLRKKAMLLLGLKMGMRESDIVNLKYDDVNWNTQSIRFIQKKTMVEVNLPMPTSVGNALFRYIVQERHHKDTPYIFLSEKAPFTQLNRSACNRALDTALPDRDVCGSGFHVTRKTFATQKLKNGVGADVVAEALGQRGTASVHRYLSLDEERMKLCALTLEQNGIGGWKNEKGN